jgi:peptidoglycan/xylan/chitin deacetylase (PgdA/CDA1 family)
MNWPGAHRSAVAFTFDFDAESVWLAEDPRNSERPGALSQGRFGAKVGVPLLLGVLERHAVPATFFVPGVVAEQHPERVREIVAAGHELAIHGYTHTSPSEMTVDEERAELARAYEVHTGFASEVVGYRSPSWELSAETLPLLAEKGLRYSSNLMDDITPYVHPDTGLVELPVQWILDDAAHWWFSSSDWARKIATPSEVREIWEEEFLGIHANGGCCVFTMHPEVTGRPGRIRFLDRLIELVKAHSDVWIARCAEIASAVLAVHAVRSPAGQGR